jgi:hypothetical protein
VSDYARTNDHEDFAETFATYIDDALGLLQIARERAAKGKPILLEKVKFMAELFKQIGPNDSVLTLVYQVRMKTDDERTRLLSAPCFGLVRQRRLARAACDDRVGGVLV